MSYSSAFGMGTWVTVDRGAKVRCLACQEDTIEITFEGHPEFNLAIDADVLEQCIPHFTEALAELREGGTNRCQDHR